MKKNNILIILDGWGIGSRDASNPIYSTNPETIENFKKNYPMTSLQASGIAVGLPWGEAGNSEVGHLTMGIGKIIYQYYPRITLSIENGEFFKNKALNNAFDSALKNNSTVHCLGSLSETHVHSAFNHILALLEMASQKNISKIYFHFFTDGRDSPPKSGKGLVEKFLLELKKYNIGKIGSLSGRYYALDRSKNWTLTERVYNLLTKGDGKKSKNPLEVFDYYYQKNLTDPYIEPTLIIESDDKSSWPLIKDGDSLIFFDFREDSIRQLASAFALDNFIFFPREKIYNSHITTMTQYDETFKTDVAFFPEKIETSLSAYLSEKGLKQMKIAETEKYYHLTYFFNGLTDKVFNNEFRILIPSKEIPHADEFPIMRAPEITQRLIAAMTENVYDFIAVNYANPDTLAHTGNYNAIVEGIKIVDQQLAKIYEVAKKLKATLFITSDHGNAERLFDPLTGEKDTYHNANPVPFYIVDENFRLKIPRTNEQIQELESQTTGSLCDVAPTILESMGLEIPNQMNGQSLFTNLISYL